MTIKIGDTEYQTRKPKDLDEQLIAATGCSAAETVNLLASNPLPGRVAAAIRPFLPEDAPPLSELASALAADVVSAANAALTLYRSVEPAPMPESGK